MEVLSGGRPMTGNIVTREENRRTGPTGTQGARESDMRTSDLRQDVRDGAVPDRPRARAVLLPNLLRPGQANPTGPGRAGMHSLQDMEACRGVRGEPAATGEASSALRPVPPEVRAGPEGARPGEGDQKPASDHPRGVRDDVRGLRADPHRAERCVLDLWNRPAGGWTPATCGGPLSCDGSCAWAAMQQLQRGPGVLSGQPVATGFGDQLSGPPIGVLEPGPVWHASVAPQRAFYGKTMCERRAVAALDGLGDPSLGEWREWSGRAFHLRRRLSAVEQQRVGPVVDIRRTPEASRRADTLGRLLAFAPPQV